MTKTYTNPFGDADEYYAEVGNAVIMTDCFETPQMVANAEITVDVNEEDLETPFADVTAQYGATIEFVRWYDEDGNLVENRLGSR